MRYFDQGGKDNWVDENNVVVGYDNGQGCCEDAGYFYLTTLTDFPPHSDWGNLGEDPDLEDWVFDKEYFLERNDPRGDVAECVVFRLVPKDGRRKGEKFLVLFNIHNGYYSHGFDFNTGDKTWDESGHL